LIKIASRTAIGLNRRTPNLLNINS
jgi:hypothetical protein